MINWILIKLRLRICKSKRIKQKSVRTQIKINIKFKAWKLRKNKETRIGNIWNNLSKK